MNTTRNTIGFGVDYGTVITGLAMLYVNSGLASPPHLLWLKPVRGNGSEESRALTNGIVDIILSATGVFLSEVPRFEPNPLVIVTLEAPIEQVRGDVEHGAQARLGSIAGYGVGRLDGLLSARGLHVSPLAPVSDWRTTMCTLSTRWGFLCQPPGDHPPLPAYTKDAAEGRTQASNVERVVDSGDGRVFVRCWHGCGHRSAPSTFAELQAAATTRCPECRLLPMPPTGKRDRAEWKRSAWKALACATVAEHWPEKYAALVADARSRAKVEHHDHELVGVADACEAVWVAVHGLAGGAT